LLVHQRGILDVPPSARRIVFNRGRALKKNEAILAAGLTFMVITDFCISHRHAIGVITDIAIASAAAAFLVWVYLENR
jgi:hypothetical protein